MDIEGAEYDGLEGIKDYYDNIKGIAIEIHFNEPFPINTRAARLFLLGKAVCVA